MSDVTINLLWMRPGLVGGSERYVTQLLKSLSEVESRPSMQLVVPPGVCEAHPFLGQYFAIDQQSTPFGRIGRIFRERHLFGTDLGSPLVHHMGGTLPNHNSNSKSVVTIYDVQYRDIPHNFSAAKRTFLNNAISRALDTADLVCVPSRFCADSLHRHFEFPKEQCRLVPPAFDVQTPRRQEPSNAPTGKFLLYPAVTWPHKSHKFLIELVEQMNDVQLVFTGGKGSSHDETLTAISRSSAVDRIMHLGVVTDQQLDTLYRQALCTVFPSQYEGFGQPIIEAMARGCPVIASEHGAIPETVGNGGISIPLDIEMWIDAVQRMHHLEHRQVLIDSGAQRAADFSSQGTSAAQLAVYRELLYS